MNGPEHKIVPKKPTKEMIEAGQYLIDFPFKKGTAEDVYLAMIQAAPTEEYLKAFLTDERFIEIQKEADALYLNRQQAAGRGCGQYTSNEGMYNYYVSVATLKVLSIVLSDGSIREVK